MSPTKTTQITLPNGEIIPVVSAEFAKETAETVRLRASAAKAGTNAVANALACKCNNDELNLLSAVLVQLGDTLATIVTQREICEDKCEQ